MQSSNLSSPTKFIELVDVSAHQKSWPSLEAFRRWYLDSGMPMNMESHQHVYLTDTASAISLYRRGQFVVELYQLHDLELVDHAHPHVDLIQMFPLGVVDGVMQWHVNDLLPAGQRHGIGEATVIPPIILVFEQWLDGHTPTSASVDWAGPILGPLHRKLIKQHAPQTRIVNGVAV